MTVLPSEEVMVWLNKHTWNPNFEILKICPEVSLDVTQTNVEMLSQTVVTPLTPPPPSSPPPCYDVVINMYCERDMTFPVACYCEWISGLQKRLRKKKKKKAGNTSGTESVRSSPPMIACQRWNDSTMIHWSTHICLKESMKRRSLWSADVSFYPIASWAERYLRAVCQGGWPEPVGHVSSWGICHGIWHNFMISTLSGGNSSGRLF